MRKELSQAIGKLKDSEIVTITPAISCQWGGRTHRLTYLKRDRDIVLAWIEEPHAPPFEKYRVVTGEIYLPIRQWVEFDRLALATVPPDVQFHPFIDWRVEQPRCPVTLNENAIVEPGTEELWEKIQGKRLQTEGYPRLHHHDRQLYRQRVAMWFDDQYCGSVAIPTEWIYRVE